MKLVERYLREVSQSLPHDERTDILDELRGSIEEQIVDRATSENRAITQDDEKAVLRSFGHPLRVASAYQQQRFLIGPDLFPAFLRTLRTLLVLILSVQVVRALVLAGAIPDVDVTIWQLVGGAVRMAMYVTVVVTASFAVLEYSGDRLRWYEEWKPESLGRSSVAVIDRTDVMTNVISEGVFLLWWNGALAFGGWLPELGADFELSRGDVWSGLYWPLNVIVGSYFVLHGYLLVRGLWTRNSLLLEIVLGVLLIGFVSFVLISQDLFSLSGNASEQFLSSLDRSARFVLAFIIAVVAWDTRKAVQLLSRGRGKRVGP